MLPGSEPLEIKIHVVDVQLEISKNVAGSGKLEVDRFRTDAVGADKILGLGVNATELALDEVDL